MRHSIIAFFCLITAFYISGCATEAHSTPDTAFEYREIYMPPTLGELGTKRGLNSVDFDWGLWGHNLAEVLPKNPSFNVFARNKDNVLTDQFCFSSNHLFNYIEEYISDNFAEEDHIRFAVVPNDNDIVCLCQKCVLAGNTPTDASPAVFNMLRRLCERFPGHTFFTADYLTTSNFPRHPMPKNMGVLVSAMNFPRTAYPTPNEEAFINRLYEWKKHVDNVYIWDYVNNFDDYFTPLPVFSIMQHRLKAYANAGVNGIFLNGSGTDYNTLSRMTAYVLDHLTQNPDIDWKPILKQYTEQYYPVAGNTIYNFMVAQDEFASGMRSPLPMYDGVQTALLSYLPHDEFIKFYDTLVDIKDEATGDEKAELDRLVDALSLTRLEIARIKGDVSGTEKLLNRLARLDKTRGIKVYNESGWSVPDYVKDYSFVVQHAEEMKDKNLLKGHKIINHTPLDEDYSDISILTDGLLGIPSNYHCGNLISSADPSLVLEVPYVEGATKLRVALVSNPGYHIGLPIYVNLAYEGHKIGSVEPGILKDHVGHSFAEFDLPSYVNGPLTVTVIRDPESRTLALDEIELY